MLPLRIKGLEIELFATVFVPLADGTRLAVRLLGKADRLDELPDGRLRVVDYKTGMVRAAELRLNSKGDAPAAREKLLSDGESGPEKVRQLWLYRYMLQSQGRPAADAAIMSLRSIPEGLLTADMSFLTADGQTFIEASEELIGQFARRILDPAEPIRKTDDLKRCEYCPYRGICAR